MTHTERVRTILVVEDNGDNRVIMKAWLEHAGFHVAVAPDGTSGLTMARSIAPDAILLDVAMPGMDGWSVARELKTDAATRAIPIVALTALTLPEDEARAREVGVDGYLAKPASLSRVLTEMERVLGL